MLAASTDGNGKEAPADRLAGVDTDLIAHLRVVAGGDEGLTEIIDAYEADTASGLDQLGRALKAGDTGTIARLAHRLRGSAPAWAPADWPSSSPSWRRTRPA